MERNVLQAYAEYSPHASSQPFRAALRGILFARTHAYIEDYRACGEENMATIAAMDLLSEAAARKAEKERREAEEEMKGIRSSGSARRTSRSGGGGIRRGDYYQYADEDNDLGERVIKEALLGSESHGFRRSHRRTLLANESFGNGEEQQPESQDIEMDANNFVRSGSVETAARESGLGTLGIPLLNTNVNAGGPNGSFAAQGAVENNLSANFNSSFDFRGETMHRKKTPEERETIRRKYDLADFITTFLVIANAGFLASWDPLAPQDGVLPYLDEINIAFSFLFLIDLILHIVCLSFIIFKVDRWYIFDALVVLIGVISAIVELSTNLSSFALGALRAFRVLALLRSVRTLETIRIIFKTIVGTIVRLRHLLLLFGLFLLVFGIAGVSQYSSRLRTRCVHYDYWNETRQLVALRDYYRLHPHEWPYGNWSQSHSGDGNSSVISSDVSGISMVGTNENLTTWATTKSVTLRQEGGGRGDFWPPSLPISSPVAVRKFDHVSFSPKKITDFVRFQGYDVFSAIVREGYHTLLRRQYECQRLLYTAGRTLFDKTDCANEFRNTVFYGDGGLGQTVPQAYYPSGSGGSFVGKRPYNASDYPFEYYALITLPPPSSQYYATETIGENPMSLSSWQSIVWKDQTCDGSDAQWLIGYRCPQDYKCERIENPQNGNVGFDNLGEAMLTLFVAVTYEGWYHSMTWTMDSVDITAAIFFVVVVTIGALFIANLAIVELTVQYELRIKEEWRFQNERKLRIRKESSNWFWGLYDKIMAEMAISHEDHDEELEDELDYLPVMERVAFHARHILKMQRFNVAMLACITANVIILGLYSSKSGDTYEKLSEIAHWCFTGLLAIELIARVLAAGNFWQFIVGSNFLNVVDAIVFCFAMSDIFTNHSVNFRPAMAMRLGRVVWEMAKFSPSFMGWVLVVTRTLKASFVIGLLLLVLIFLFGVVGLYLFGGTFCNLYDSDVAHVLPDNSDPKCPMRPRSNYDTIASAMLTTLIVTSVDGWDQIMYTGMQARGGIFCLYFITVLLVCKYLVVNLLIGIFLHESSLARKLEDDRLLREDLDADKTKGRQRRKRDKLKQFLGSFFATPEQAVVDELDPRFSKFQLQLQKIVESFAFKVSMVILTFISCFCIAMESPLRAPDTKEEALLLIADVSSNSIFALEALLKVIAYGLIMGRQSYFRRDPWNVFDLLVVAISFTSQGLVYAKKGDRTQPVFSALRVLRAVRLIRFADRTEGFRILFRAVTKSLVSLFFLFFMLFALGTLWGVMGVQWFAGAFSRCTDLQFTTEALCVEAGQSWVTPYNNFDNMAQAYMSLLAISTTENWADIMYNGMDAVGKGQGPVVNEGKRFAIYFAAFVTIGGLYFVALLISVLIQSYQDAKRHFPHQNYFLNPHEQAWQYTHYDILSKVPLVDYDSIATTRIEAVFVWVRTRCRKIERSPLFDLLVYCTIVVGFIVAAVDHYPKSTAMSEFISISSLIFAIWFCVEMTIRIISEGPRGFFKSAWNRFDLLITFFNLLGIIMEIVLSQSTFVTVFRLLRAIRMLRLVRKSRTLQSVLKRILLALYSLKNTVAVLFLVYFIFGVMGMRMFGRATYSKHINQRQNFNDIINAMLIMVRCSTGGEWLQLVESIAQRPPLCDGNLDGCITPAIAQTYFIIYEIIAQYIFINLFTSVIFDIFTETDEIAMTVNNFDAGQFIKLWMCFDPEGTYRIESQYLVSFLRGIPRHCILSLGPIHEARRRQMEISFLKKLNLTEFTGKVELQDLMASLMQKYYEESMIDKNNKMKAKALRIAAAKMRERGEADEDEENNSSDDERERRGRGQRRGSGRRGPTGKNGHLELNSDADNGVVSETETKPTLNHDTSRKLRRNADKVFRREARNLHKPMGEEHHVAKRYAISVIEQYYLQSRERKREQEKIRAELEEVQLDLKRFERELENKRLGGINRMGGTSKATDGEVYLGGIDFDDLGLDLGPDSLTKSASTEDPNMNVPKKHWAKLRKNFVPSAQKSLSIANNNNNNSNNNDGKNENNSHELQMANNGSDEALTLEQDDSL